ncbi:MAG: serine hydrolase [Bacteroidales bacterium]|nr:serine hydrolase [Bacteroidales bacterium]
MNKKTSILLVLLLTCLHIKSVAQKTDPPFLKHLNEPWVDSVLNSLTTEEKIGQLLWLPAYSNRGIDYDVALSEIVRKYKPGGLIFFQGTAEKQAELINHLRKVSKVPPVIALDAEWGPGMRLSGIEKFPYQMTLGAVQNDSLIYRMGAAIAGMLRKAGVDVNLAPVADVNNNPSNPVINVRSFGEDPENVMRKAYMFMKGMQDNGIIATGKHFPGHGDTETDSHLDLPVIDHDSVRLNNTELAPFRYLIGNGISGIMPGHLAVPALTGDNKTPVTLSPGVLTGLLKNDLGFKGLVISDAMNMGGITKYASPGEAEALALAAGMDVLEFVTDPEITVKKITEFISNNKLTVKDIDERCRKVLALKYWAGLARSSDIGVSGLTSEINTPQVKALIQELYAAAITVLNNDQNIIPVRNLNTTRIATVAVGRNEITAFQDRISSYTKATHFTVENISDTLIARLSEDLAAFDLVIAGVYGPDRVPTSYRAGSEINKLIRKINNTTKCISVWFGNSYLAGTIGALSESDGLVVTYQNNTVTEDLAAQMLFGGIGARGKLPVTISDKYRAGCGLITPANLRLKYGLPESAGVSSALLVPKVDSIALSGIAAKAYPGCEVMIARKGTVIFHRCYGFHTYGEKIPVDKNDLFDLASVTKVSAATPGLMLLNSQGLFDPDKTLGYYLPYFRSSDKSGLLLRDMLAHQAGLKAWIPFWKEAVKENGSFKSRTFSTGYSKKYPLRVADELYMHRRYRDVIFREIKRSPLSREKKYVYSDLTFIIVPEIIERITGRQWYEFVSDSVYHRLGAWDICFNPYKGYPYERIVPTEYDSLFRKQLLHATVHDEGSAMLGGISGHAGLFATANDLMKLMEMYRRMGQYGGEQIIDEGVMREYTRVQFPENKNRRGLGFDKPLTDNASLPHEKTYPTYGVSPESFGHSGYTGTFVWVDPVYEISYVFLTNRVYPTRNNNLISDLNIRTNILQAVYDSIIKP